METLERIIAKGPDAKLINRAYEQMQTACDNEQQLLLRIYLLRHLSVWRELSSTYQSKTGNYGFLNRDPYFGNIAYIPPRGLATILAQALLGGRAMLSDEALPEAIMDYSLTATALQMLTHKSPLEKLKSRILNYERDEP